MQPIYLKKNTRSFEHSFQIRRAVVQHTYDIWHYHQELEMMYIIKSSGTRFVGDSIKHFSDGDLVLVGPNLPHVWKNDKLYYEKGSGTEAEVIVVHFLEDFAGKEFFNLPEFVHITNLLKSSRQGIQIMGKTRKVIAEKLKGMVGMNGGQKIIELVSVLHLIAQNEEYQTLSSPGFSNSFQSKNTERINNVYDYIMNNFTEDISLQNVASVANMNETAFCRYFKTATNKTYTQFLNDIRIGFACKLLIYEKMTISQVCYESGFRNLSHFNRMFKSIMGTTPQEYQKQY